MPEITSSEEEVLMSLPLGLLLGRISAVFRERLLEACGEAGDDVRLIGLAMAIDQNPDATQASYARFLGIDLNTASRLISRAEERKILRRVPSLVDRRAVTLRLSRAGHDLAREGAKAVADIEAKIEAEVGEEQYRAFRQTAERILLLTP